MANTTTKLNVNSRTAEGSRAARRLRRSGRVPGVIYGGGGEPVGFDADARELRVALAGSGAVLDLSVDGGKATPVVLKEAQRHPVRGETIHVDLLRVNLDVEISAIVPLELLGIDDAPGVKEGGILEQITRELNVEALPTAIPESISHEIGEMQIGETILLSAISLPEGVTLMDDPEETVVATLSPPRLQSEVEDDIESETEVVGAVGRRGRRRLRGLLRRGVVPLRRPFGGGGGAIDWLIVGLGNPGREHAGTRHNVGFMVAEALVERWGLGRAKDRFKARMAEGRVRSGPPGSGVPEGPRVAVLCPQTYMNDAGPLGGAGKRLLQAAGRAGAGGV